MEYDEYDSRRASFTDAEYEEYYGPTVALDEENTLFEDSADANNDAIDTDDTALPVVSEDDGSSLLGGSSITTIRDSPTRYVVGRDIGLPSSSPTLPSASALYSHTMDDHPSSDIASSPPVFTNRFQEAWDLEQSNGVDLYSSEVDLKPTPNHNSLYVLDHGKYPEADGFCGILDCSCILDPRSKEDIANNTIITPPEIEPLTFEDIQKLKEAGKVLRVRGHEQGYMDFVSKLNVPCYP